MMYNVLSRIKHCAARLAFSTADKRYTITGTPGRHTHTPNTASACCFMYADDAAEDLPRVARCKWRARSVWQTVDASVRERVELGLRSQNSRCLWHTGLGALFSFFRSRGEARTPRLAVRGTTFVFRLAPSRLPVRQTQPSNAAFHHRRASAIASSVDEGEFLFVNRVKKKLERKC